MSYLTINSYYYKLREYPFPKGKTTRVFIMSDHYYAVQELTRLLTQLAQEKQVKIVVRSFCPKGVNGHDQGTFNKRSVKQKERSLLRLVAEVEVMRKIPYLLLPLSSNIARFILHSHRGKNTVVKMDRAPLII